MTYKVRKGSKIITYPDFAHTTIKMQGAVEKGYLAEPFVLARTYKNPTEAETAAAGSTIATVRTTVKSKTGDFVEIEGRIIRSLPANPDSKSKNYQNCLAWRPATATVFYVETQYLGKTYIGSEVKSIEHAESRAFYAVYVAAIEVCDNDNFREVKTEDV